MAHPSDVAGAVPHARVLSGGHDGLYGQCGAIFRSSPHWDGKPALGIRPSSVEAHRLGLDGVGVAGASPSYRLGASGDRGAGYHRHQLGLQSPDYLDLVFAGLGLHILPDTGLSGCRVVCMFQRVSDVCALRQFLCAGPFQHYSGGLDFAARQPKRRTAVAGSGCRQRRADRVGRPAVATLHSLCPWDSVPGAFVRSAGASLARLADSPNRFASLSGLAWSC